MKKFLRIILIATLSFFVFASSLFMWLMYWSPRAKRSWENVENMKKLEVGMTSKDVRLIMGEPDKVRFEDSILFYQPPFASSSGIVLIMSNSELVKIKEYE